MPRTSPLWPENFLLNVFACEPNPGETVKALPPNVHILAIYMLREFDREHGKDYTDLVLGHYKDGRTIATLSDLYALPKTNISRKITKACRILRHPSYSDIIRHGLRDWHKNELDSARKQAVDDVLAKIKAEHPDIDTGKNVSVDLLESFKNLSPQDIIEFKSFPAGTDLSNEDITRYHFGTILNDTRAYNVLMDHEIQTVYDLVCCTEEGLLGLPGMGTGTCYRILDALAARNLTQRTMSNQEKLERRERILFRKSFQPETYNAGCHFFENVPLAKINELNAYGLLSGTDPYNDGHTPATDIRRFMNKQKDSAWMISGYCTSSDYAFEDIVLTTVTLLGPVPQDQMDTFAKAFDGAYHISVNPNGCTAYNPRGFYAHI